MTGAGRSDAKGCVHVCQGPPRCDLEGDAAVAAQQAGCPWCKRIFVFDDGSEVEVEPSSDSGHSARAQTQPHKPTDVVIDRVAAAIYAEARRHQIAPAIPDMPPPPAWRELNKRAKKYWRDLAVAALDAA